MAIPGFTADECAGPTIQAYRSPTPMPVMRGLTPQNFEAQDLSSEDGEDLDGGDLEGDDTSDDAAEVDGDMEEDSSDGDA
jgi:hypothetical protein